MPAAGVQAAGAYKFSILSYSWSCFMQLIMIMYDTNYFSLATHCLHHIVLFSRDKLLPAVSHSCLVSSLLSPGASKWQQHSTSQSLVMRVWAVLASLLGRLPCFINSLLNSPVHETKLISFLIKKATLTHAPVSTLSPPSLYASILFFILPISSKTPWASLTNNQMIMMQQVASLLTCLSPSHYASSDIMQM